jgi:hypothetical protein
MNWWETAYIYDIGQAVFVPFVRPLYPPDHEDGPVEPGADVEAIKRICWKLGRWSPPPHDREFSNAFAHGKSSNVSDSGLEGVQRQAKVAGANGAYGERTHDILIYSRIPQGRDNAGKYACDDYEIALFQEAAKKFPKDDGADTPLPGGKLTRKAIPSPNYSSRGGSSVRLIILHTAEGARTIEELGNFFSSSSSGVSSHTGIDDKAGVIGEYVKRGNKAWTAGNANPVAVQVEMCAFAKWSRDEWHRHPNMLENCARWIAEEAAAFGIPITRLNASTSQSGRGVCQHADVAGWTGSSHWDCGGGFPMDEVLEMARGA